jgi:hypothetical protein
MISFNNKELNNEQMNQIGYFYDMYSINKCFTKISINNVDNHENIFSQINKIYDSFESLD